LLIVPLAALLAGGCGSVDRRAEAAAAVAVRWQQAVAAHDGAAACALLAPDTAAELDDPSCAEQILDEGLPGPGTPDDTHVYGQWAQVRLDDDTMFLAVFPGGWRVVAAGCEPQGGDRPYDCTVHGG
jgi:hypothetical protein